MRTITQTFLNRRRIIVGITLGLLLSGVFSEATTLLTGFTESAFGASLNTGCTVMAFAPDGRLFVSQQNGALRVIKNGVLLGPAFMTLTVDSNGERGLLGVAFDPSFSSNHFIYVYHTVPAGPSNVPPPHNRVSRYTANGDVVMANSELILLDLDNLSSATNHNGGALHFGPDGKLYISVGENANGPNSQSLANRLGKILRINTDSYNSIPSDNPTTFPGIAGSTTGLNKSIWAVGLRNPFTFSFQPGTTRMFINDVGSNAPGAGGNGVFEEVNDGIAGSNYGWNVIEGPSSNPNFTTPLYSYVHNNIGAAIAGSAFYNPAILQFPQSYVGKYFFGDYLLNFIRVMDLSNNAVTDFATSVSNPVDIRVGPDGALYYLTAGGQVMRIQATPSQALNISTRAQIGLNDNVLIGGFIVSGSAAKKVIVRARGPSTGLTGALADPTLELLDGNGATITSNDDWRVPVQNQTAVQATGLQPGDDHESAIVATLQPGNYTAIVKGKNNTTGTGLVEIYDINGAAASQLGNISGRAFVQTGDDVAIGGFIIGNNIGASKVIVRARGPSLAGVNNTLADPTLELLNGNGVVIGSNDNWQDDATQAAAITASGLAPTNSLESAISTSLAPGNYTAIIAGKNGGTGIGLIEVYKQ
jgi:glucose/arabinose dehydrogenase